VFDHHLERESGEEMFRGFPVGLEVDTGDAQVIATPHKPRPLPGNMNCYNNKGTTMTATTTTVEDNKLCYT
jgi:hypothetical protein